MNKSTKIYLKLFLTSGLIFGFLMSLRDYIDEGKIGFAKSIFQALFFGGLMAWTFGRSMNKSKLKIGDEESTEDDFKAS